MHPRELFALRKRGLNCATGINFLFSVVTYDVNIRTIEGNFTLLQKIEDVTVIFRFMSLALPYETIVQAIINHMIGRKSLI